MTDKEPKLFQKGESFVGREAMMQERRQAQLLAQQQQQKPTSTPVTPVAQKDK